MQINEFAEVRPLKLVEGQEELNQGCSHQYGLLEDQQGARAVLEVSI